MKISENSPDNRRRGRRDFLRTGAVITAGVALAPAAILGRDKAVDIPKRKIRIGVVGGGFGCSFQWHNHPNCIVEAVSDLRPERCRRLKDVYGCDKSYESLEKLILDESIEAVAVFTGAPDHVRHVTACLGAGKHVICAVPAAITLDGAEELLDRVKATGLTYMMAETSYYRQPAISARRFFDEGRFGRLVCTAIVPS